ncbi:MAG: hypothetical protein U1E06_17410 [Tabrizicola sp.]|nr:hypothetical protein [Tabrizicola sp.]MDP3262094.1 hypothetical protein [Tabrizicola sp.]MDP3648160.1 hypothetical protein [Paracoccaceae bacterium]MDZ4068589.1 hypothetical protein [Tabrizicola sp.]
MTGRPDASWTVSSCRLSYVDDFCLMMWVSLAAMPLALILRRPARG